MKLLTTEDGSHTLESGEYGVTYHSIHGAIQETQTVFIDAALHYKGQTESELKILEIGFGTGLNALMTFQAAQKAGYTVHYTGIEAKPISLEIAAQLNYADLLGDASLQNILDKMHGSQNQWLSLSPQFSFYKKIDFFEHINDQEQFDIVYYDAFAPTAQPELWTSEQLARVYAALKKGGVLTTYCAKGVVKRALKEVGFELQALPGPKGKREMTRAVKS